MPQLKSGRLAGGNVMPSAIITTWFDDPRASEVDVRKARTSLVVTGILALLGGAAAIVIPPIATLTIALFVGWILVYSGVVMGIHAWAQRGAGHAGERALMALLTFAVGAYMVLFPVERGALADAAARRLVRRVRRAAAVDRAPAAGAAGRRRHALQRSSCRSCWRS